MNLAPGVVPTALTAADNAAIGSDGNIYSWPGGGTYGSNPFSSPPTVVSLAPGVGAISLSAGYDFTLAIGSDRNLYSWGYNDEGQLGNGSVGSGSRTTPGVVTLAPNVSPVAIAAGVNHALAIGSDGRLYTWGDDSSGELGNGTYGYFGTPEPVSLPAGVSATAIAAGDEDSFVIGSDGNLYAWGGDDVGELGDGHSAVVNGSYPVNVLRPEQISLANGVRPITIVAGYYHTLAIGSDHRLYAWGNNLQGQIGDGTMTERDTPEAISLAPGVNPRAISASYFDSMAIGSDGELYQWGTATSQTEPTPTVVPLGADLTPTVISAGPAVTMVIACTTHHTPPGHARRGIVDCAKAPQK